MDLLRLRGHHIAFYAEMRYSPFFIGKDLESYGEIFEEGVKDIFRKIDVSPAKIIVVRGLDDLCNIKPACPRKDGYCKESHELDDACLRGYGMKIGDILRKETLLGKILKYYRRTGFYSFRDKFWAEKGLILRSE